MPTIYEQAPGLKAEIESSPEIIQALDNYVNHEPFEHLHFLGEGSGNIHFRLGQLESGLWLATREHTKTRGITQRIICETYSQGLQNARDCERKTSKVCLGVCAHSPEDETEDRHFLIVEDLTKGGGVEFQGNNLSNREWGYVGGEKVYYDFKEDTNLFGEYNLMSDKLMIHLSLK